MSGNARSGIPQPQGFALVVEPVERERIERMAEEYKKGASGFGPKVTEAKFEETCRLRVVAAGPGLTYETGFIANHIKVGDVIMGTNTDEQVAKEFSNPKECWFFDGKRYLVYDSRNYDNINGQALFIVR